MAYAAPGVGRPNGSATSRWLAVGQAVKNGVAAANAARFGFVGDLDILRDTAFANTRGLRFDAEAFRDDFATPVMQEVSFKPWCGAKQTMSATHALRMLMPIDPDDIAGITVRIPPAYADMIGHQPTAANRSSHLTSLRYQMALSALTPDSMHDASQFPGPQSARLYDFCQRITVEIADELQEFYPTRFPAEVSLVTGAGETRTMRMLSAPGDPEMPMSDNADRREVRAPRHRRRAAAPQHPAGGHQAGDRTALRLAPVRCAGDRPAADRMRMMQAVPIRFAARRSFVAVAGDTRCASRSRDCAALAAQSERTPAHFSTRGMMMRTTAISSDDPPRLLNRWRNVETIAG